MSSLLTLVLLGIFLPEATSQTCWVEYGWRAIDFDWINAQERQEAMDNGTYDETKCMLQEISFYYSHIFVTVPRLERGVPSTLNTVLTSRIDGVSPILKAFPSLEHNTLGRYKLQYVCCHRFQNVDHIY